MAVARDAKARAKRIDLAYFQKPHRFRRWKGILSVVAPALAAAWIAAMALKRDERIYTSGPMSPRHAMLETRCESCHTSPWAERYTNPAEWQDRLDRACLVCHDAPVHHDVVAGFTRGPKGHETSARCSLCHLEHKDLPRLAEVRDRHCVACHADLPAAGSEPHAAACPVGSKHEIQRKIAGFADGHPEFALVAKKIPDPTAVAFNHAVHLHPDTSLKKELLQSQLAKLPGRRGVEKAADGSLALGCSSCHRPTPTGESMAPLHYETHCRDCHALKLKDQKVPHEAPDVVRDFLRSRLSKEGKGGDALAEQVTEAEIPLYTSDPDGCMKCHKTDLGADFPASPPVVARTGLRRGPPGQDGEPRRWFVHSFFSHETHRELRCLECHAGADTSRLTADLLLPSQALCLKCHSPAGGVPDGCSTCHVFHDRSRARAGEGPLRIRDVSK